MNLGGYVFSIANIPRQGNLPRIGLGYFTTRRLFEMPWLV